jgi:DNA-binding beta-propeller fold protein YncE
MKLNSLLAAAVLLVPAARADTLWVTNGSTTVYEYDSTTGAPTGTLTVPGNGALRITQGGGFLWLLDTSSNAVYEYSPNGTFVTTAIAANGPSFDANDLLYGPDGNCTSPEDAAQRTRVSTATLPPERIWESSPTARPLRDLTG